MCINRFCALFGALVFIWSCRNEVRKTTEITSIKPPNIIYILADYLGYGEVGAYGQEKIETPNIDALAANGMLFTQHYSSAPVCAPARCMLLTGLHAGHAAIRSNMEWNERGPVWDYLAMERDSTLEGQGPMPSNTITFPHLLQKVGYATGIIGKWGLGAPQTKSVPNDMGFDYFYGYNCQREAHTYYPLHLYENRVRVFLQNDTVAPHTKLPKGADPYDEASYAPYTLKAYTPDLMFRALTNFIDRNKAHPFFLYWATPLPHVPLQAPKRWVDHYRKKFGDETPYLGDKGYFPNRYPHATYAAMISYLDENIGKMIDQLKRNGLYENTLIVFTSDNGPSYAGGADPVFFESAKPFDGTYGRGKGFLYEGGIRIPMIVSWPGHIAPGTRSDVVSAQYDMMATFADIAGYEPPANTDGLSLAPTWLGSGGQKIHDFLYWEFPSYGGQVAIRMGDDKLVRQNLLDDKKQPTMEVYDLTTDIRESDNLVMDHPEVVSKAGLIFKQQRQIPEIPLFRIPRITNGLLSAQDSTEYLAP